MRLCVWIFAFLSAYGLTIQYQKLGQNPSVKVVSGFMFNRWKALMRPYWIVFVLTLVLSPLMGKTPLELFGGSWRGLLAGAFALSDLVSTKMAVAAWWYMCFAQLLLLFIPLFCNLCRKYGLLVLVAATVILPFAGEGIISPYGGYYYNYLFVVILGVLCAQSGWLDKQGKKGSWMIRVVQGIGIVLAIALCVWINYKFSAKDQLRLTKLLMGAASVLVCLFTYRCIIWKPLENILVYLGKYSGYIFLTHAFGYTYFPKIIFWNQNAVVTYLTLFFFGLVCAIVCVKFSLGADWIVGKIRVNNKNNIQ